MDWQLSAPSDCQVHLHLHTALCVHLAIVRLPLVNYIPRSLNFTATYSVSSPMCTISNSQFPTATAPFLSISLNIWLSHFPYMHKNKFIKYRKSTNLL